MSRKRKQRREVLEETGVKAEILKYLGEIHYTYKENWDENKLFIKRFLVSDEV
ncbi:MAG: NUDIX domain-containing protein [Paeniclostridium sp.]